MFLTTTNSQQFHPAQLKHVQLMILQKDVFQLTLHSQRFSQRMETCFFSLCGNKPVAVGLKE